MADSGSSGGAGGYNIPISVSAAETFSVPQSLVSPTNIVFGSAGQVGGDVGSNPYAYNPATAVSSASERDASSNLSQGPQTAGQTTGGLSDTTKYILIGSGVLVAVVLTIVTIVILRKK